MKQREFTAVYQKRGRNYIAWVEEIPGVNTQGKTKVETRENLAEALEMVLSANRMISRKRAAGTKRESLTVMTRA